MNFFRIPSAAVAMLVIMASVRPGCAESSDAVYEHPALNARITVHVADAGSPPETVAYDGPKGHYVMTYAELRKVRSEWDFKSEDRVKEIEGLIAGKSASSASAAPKKEEDSSSDETRASRERISATSSGFSFDGGKLRGMVETNNDPPVSFTVMGGGGSMGGQTAGNIGVFMRVPLTQISPALDVKYGNIGLSVGVNMLMAGGDSDVLERSRENAIYYNDKTHHYGFAEVDRTVTKEIPGTSLYEVARVDYETPRVKGVSVYGGIGGGVAVSDKSRYTTERIEATFSNGDRVESSRNLDREPGDSWNAAFATAFAGVKVPLGFYLVKELVVEFEHVLGRDEIKSDFIRLGVGW